MFKSFSKPVKTIVRNAFLSAIPGLLIGGSCAAYNGTAIIAAGIMWGGIFATIIAIATVVVLGDDGKLYG